MTDLTQLPQWQIDWLVQKVLERMSEQLQPQQASLAAVAGKAKPRPAKD